ncbi:MAG: hydantoinase B/oxoprolinase family protein [Desulfuromonadaceae bacterium]|nr:hydantoinase B/oxoprolinase family protein [Desulfuromonadaceae bacterium]
MSSSRNAGGRGFRFAIDRGGTFTDVYAELPDGRTRVLKLLSEDPGNYADAPREGIRRILAEEGYAEEELSGAAIASIRMGTTVATNALLERRGTPTLLVITAGLGDVLHIGDQTRPELFALQVKKPVPLAEQVLEVAERVRPAQAGEAGDLSGRDGRCYVRLQPPQEQPVREGLRAARAQGCESVAVVFAHAHACPEHELWLERLAREVGFEQISLSHRVMPLVKLVPRGETCVVDAYLTPAVQRYVRSFRQGFSDGLQHTDLLFMASDGGLMAAEDFHGSRALLSGPAGGVVGYARTCEAGFPGQPVIGFDMGGTSTDVSRYAGQFAFADEARVAGVRLQAPQLDIRTVAAGGGSRLFFRHGLFEVGPESAGSHPGPVCYRKNGHLAITDANLLLGRLQPDFFPHIFGADEKQPLDRDATVAAFEGLTREVNGWMEQQSRPALTAAQVAAGFIDVANEVMARPIREVSVQRGYDLAEHVLACFGGAGGQHACAMARKLGIRRIHIHRHAGILSAYGMRLAQRLASRQEAASGELTSGRLSELLARLAALEDEARRELVEQGSGGVELQVERYLQLRYEGTDQGLLIAEPEDGDYAAAFQTAYRREFGFDLQRPVMVDHLRVRVSSPPPVLTLPADDADHNSGAPEPLALCDCFFDGAWQQTPVFAFDALPPGQPLTGPALLIQETATLVIEPGCVACLRGDDLVIEVETAAAATGTAGRENTQLDPVQLALFSHRFMSVAEQMGQTLRRTAVSTNIKERCDFSCALFDASGNLVANAPHTPVHLGAMSEAVKQQMVRFAGQLEPGDVLLSNHPRQGGSHLPDMTVITPLWRDDEVVLYLANRGHHADIGGLTPGSMPPFSCTLSEEGCAIAGMKLVERGVFQEAAIRARLATGGVDRAGQRVPGTRRLADNLSDLRAQVAANQCGARLMEELFAGFGTQRVQAYLGYIQDHAEAAVCAALRDLAARHGAHGTTVLRAREQLDDGTPLCLALSIEPNGRACFDFSGSGAQQWGNLNAPRAVTLSAVLYCLRCLVEEALPLNQGCLRPVQLEIPVGSVLDPCAKAAVVGGNVLTSQRLVDLIFRAFGCVAASQGCMNNLTFGDEDFGYYETLGGGTGAGPGWAGADGVHSHMTNTRITDVEILENRYPVLVRTFSLRRGSGGEGRWRGGDGLVRELEFLRPLQVAILSERRVFAPYGLEGGANGRVGYNSLLRVDGSCFALGGKNALPVVAGDRIRIETPGGGGYGAVEQRQKSGVSHASQPESV